MSAAFDVKKKTSDEYNLNFITKTQNYALTNSIFFNKFKLFLTNSISIIIITTTEMKTQVLVHKM